MNVWNKAEWIKDILSKSGTDITEIKDENDKDNKSNKMVYYTASLPIMMKTEPASMQCINGNDMDSIRASNLSNNTLIYSDNQLFNNLMISGKQQNDLKANIHQQFQVIPQHHQQQHHQQQQQQQYQPQQQQTPQPQSQQSQQQQQQQPPQPQPQQKPQFKCDQCNMLFGSKSAHTSHIKSHAKLVQQQLGRVSTTVSVTTVNTSNISSSDPYQCDVCKKTFAVPARLVRHYRTHTGERPFECEFCHKMFSVKENLQVHRRIHTKERPYKCEVCGRAFEHSGKLHRHMRIHTGERPHKCSVCGKTFIQSGQLVIHMRTHTGEKPYKCPVEGCGKGFTCSKQLKVHSRTHTGEKPYHCDICFRDFGYNHVLKLHRVQHYGSKCYKCTICEETFKSKKEMEAHIKGHANEIPDEDGGDSSSFSVDVDSIKMEKSIETPTSGNGTTATGHTRVNKMSNNIKLPETPIESSSEANSDADESSYYQTNIYQRFEPSSQVSTGNQYHVSENSGGVNPALLAAVSIATSSVASMDVDMDLSANNGVDVKSRSPVRSPNHQVMSPVNGVVNNFAAYEPLAVMRQQGYFTPRVEDYRSSIDAASEIVKRVEAALASAEPLLTPPRSSPDRSSSPDSDSGILMADRDIMSLPLRKRKFYLKEDITTSNSRKTEDSPVMRISSVIQFAKAS